jgi:hypothetical protein
MTNFISTAKTALWRIRKSDGLIVQSPAVIPGNNNILIHPGRSGNELLLTMDNNKIAYYDGVVGTATVLAGTGTAGYSVDGTAATTTNIMTNCEGAAVNPSGQIYFVDGSTGVSGSFIRIRTIDGSGNLQTLMGSIPFSGDGGPIAKARFAAGIQAYINPYNSKIYMTDGYFLKTWDPSGDTLAAVVGNGVSGVPANGASAASAFFAPDFVQFLSSTVANIWSGASTLSWNGTSYTKTTAVGNDSLSVTATSACDGKNTLTNCIMHGDLVATNTYDVSGNLYTFEGNGNTTAGRIYKVDTSGNVTQIMGNGTFAWTADCNVDGCAKTAAINISAYLRYIGYDSVNSRILYIDYDGTNYMVRAISSTGRLSTLPGTFAAANINNWGGGFDGAQYFYINLSSSIFRIDTVNGTTTSLTPPTTFGQTVSFFTTTAGGSPYFITNGAVYRWDP